MKYNCSLFKTTENAFIMKRENFTINDEDMNYFFSNLISKIYSMDMMFGLKGNSYLDNQNEYRNSINY